MSCIICGNKKIMTGCSIMVMNLCSTECHLELHRRENIK